ARRRQGARRRHPARRRLRQSRDRDPRHRGPARRRSRGRAGGARMTVNSPGTGTQTPAAPADTRQVIRPYGDTTGDGMVQMSFTLPVPAGKRAEAAALQLADKMGLDPASVVHSKAMGPDFTFFIVYGKVRHLIDYA